MSHYALRCKACSSYHTVARVSLSDYVSLAERYGQRTLGTKSLL